MKLYFTTDDYKILEDFTTFSEHGNPTWICSSKLVIVRSFQDYYQSSVSRNPSKVSILFSPRHSYSGNIQQTRKKKKSVKPSSICNCIISHIWEHEFFIFGRLAVREILLKYLTFWGNFLMFSFAKKGIKILKTQNIVASALKSCLLHKKLK